MLLSGVSNAYTLILSIIYIAIACLLFTIRKSETAGKPALSWKLQFAILCGFLLNAGINIDYIRLSAQNNYYVMTDYENYFENVIKNIKISDKNTIKFIADIYNDNAKNLGSINEERYYTRSSHSYATYEVFF